jgi:hypothetical protein
VATPDYLTVADLVMLAGSAAVTQLADDDNSGAADTGLLDTFMSQAEHFAANVLLRSWTREQIELLAVNDEGFRASVAWVALEMLSERRQEHLADGGKGRYWAQYERSVQYFDRLSKSHAHSVGEVAAGRNAQEGGGARPDTGVQPRFVFAPIGAPGYGTGRYRGGF